MLAKITKFSKSNLKKLLLATSSHFILIFSLLSARASASLSTPESGGATVHASSCTHDFFGLVPWYKYLTKDFTSGSCNITKFQVLPNGSTPSDIPLVLLAIVDDLLRIAGIVAIGFVIYGAIRYITSQGNPDDTSKAQSTIINALVGLVVAVIAVAFVSYLGNRLGG